MHYFFNKIFDIAHTYPYNKCQSSLSHKNIPSPEFEIVNFEISMMKQP